MKAGQRRSQQRGQALVLIALGSAALFGLAALAVDGGIAEADRRFLQAVGDGAALAGAQHLNASPTAVEQQEARQAAVLYATSTLSGGNTNPGLPAGCTGQASDFGTATHTPGTAACDPDSAHALYVETPYCPGGSCHNDQVLVRLFHFNQSNLAQVVGVGQTSIASRSVAQYLAGGSSLGLGLYVTEELQVNGNVPIDVGGNIYVGGCITATNQTSVTVVPTSNGQVGKIEVYYGTLNGQLATSYQAKQDWAHGAGAGEHCRGQVYTAANTSVSPSLPASFGAAGHLANGSDNTCGHVDAPSHFPGACPAGEPPNNILKPAPPSYGTVDPWNCSSITRVNFPTGSNQTVRPGCYDPCSVGAENIGDSKVTGGVPDTDVFEPGTYSFFPSTTGCYVNFNGSAKVSDPPPALQAGCAAEGSTNPLPLGSQACGTDGASAGGVTFFLYNGTSWCFANNCGASQIGTLTLNAPTNQTYLNDSNGGMLIFDCPSGGVPCGPGGGQFVVNGPSATVHLTGLIYAPTATCSMQADSTQSVLGGVICQNLTLQGGNGLNGDFINFGGPSLPTPLFQTSLLE